MVLAYCGLVFYSKDLSTSTRVYWEYRISTGLGSHDVVTDSDGDSFRDINCSSGVHDHESSASVSYLHYRNCRAACSLVLSNTCPRGWGTVQHYNAYELGCYYGSYYPDARMETITTTHYRLRKITTSIQHLVVAPSGLPLGCRSYSQLLLRYRTGYDHDDLIISLTLIIVVTTMSTVTLLTAVLALRMTFAVVAPTVAQFIHSSFGHQST